MIENPILEFFIKHEFIIEIFLAACFFLPWKDRRKFWYLILPAFILLSGAFGYIPNCPEIVYYLIIIACIFFYSLCSFKLDIMLLPFILNATKNIASIDTGKKHLYSKR